MPKRQCQDCGVQISKSSKKCQDCFHASRIGVPRPDLVGKPSWNAGKTLEECPQMANSGRKKGGTPWNKGVATGIEPWNKGTRGLCPVPWNKGMKGSFPWNRGPTGIAPWNKGLNAPAHVRKKLSDSHKGQFVSPSTRAAISAAHKGKKLSPEHCEKMRRTRLAMMTPEFRLKLRIANANGGEIDWTGLIAKERAKIRNSTFYRDWRNKVYDRDNRTCQRCGAIGGRICAHHIKEFATHPELRFCLENGETLCRPCHLRHHGDLRRRSRCLKPRQQQTSLTPTA